MQTRCDWILIDVNTKNCKYKLKIDDNCWSRFKILWKFYVPEWLVVQSEIKVKHWFDFKWKLYNYFFYVFFFGEKFQKLLNDDVDVELFVAFYF